MKCLRNPIRTMALLLFFLFSLIPAHAFASEDSKAVSVRIGWQIPAATQGQIIQVIKRSNLLEIHGLEPVLIPFSYGGPQVEAAFQDELDVMISGDQPAINLRARGGKWKIVARLFQDGAATIVPPESPIKTLTDLRGKTVASAFGSIGERDAFLQQQESGLDPKEDVNNKDVDILEIRRKVLAGGIDSWGGIHAAVVWDPLLSRFLVNDKARVLYSKPYLGVVSMSEEFLHTHPEAAAEFLVALMRAWHIFSQNPDRVMKWYIEDTQLDYSPEELIAARLDRNFQVTDVQDIDLSISAADVHTLRQGATWGASVGNGNTDVEELVDTSLATRAREIVSTEYLEDAEFLLPSFDSSQGDDIVYVFDSIPMVLVFLVMVLGSLFSIEVGLWLGKRVRHRFEKVPLQPMATVVGAVLGMMAFVIALTFGAANGRFNERKAALLSDVTAIQTAYMQANLLSEPHRTTVRSLLRDYVHMRAGIVYAYGQPEKLALVQRRADTLQKLMWSHVETLTHQKGDHRVHIMFASSLNQVFNLHTKRVVLGAHYRIPTFVWIALLFASTLAMLAVGYQFGLAGRRILLANLTLSLTFALVMMLAIDLDRTGDGLVSVNQQPMLDLLESMKKSGTR